MNHRTDIDGLRALAVIPVVLFHMDLTAFGGGFTGVDVFFVISGFLITSIIAHDIETPGRRFSLWTFYERRVRRIFPALFTVLAVTTVLAALILLPRDLEDYSKTLVATAAFASNIHFYRQWGYFDAEAHTKPLLHTWSLAVEEQYYFVFPLLMIGLYRWLKVRERVRHVLLGIAALSFALAAWQVLSGSSAAAFYLAPARAWELLVGSLLALGAVPVIRNRFAAEGAALLGLALLAYGFLGFSLNTPFPGPAALVPCLGAGLLIHSGCTGQTRVSRMLSWRPLVFVGLISYSLYLWHWTLLSLARHWTLDPLTLAQSSTVVAVSVLAACASWKWIEQPIRGVKQAQPGGKRLVASRRTVFAWGAALSVAAVAVGVTGVLANGWPGRVPAATLALDADREDFNVDRPKCHGGDGTTIEYRNTCRFGAPGAVPRYAVWGDSHAAELSVALGEYAAQAGEAVRMISYSRCPPARPVEGAARNPKCLQHNRSTLTSLSADAAVQTVFLIARYSQAREDMGERYFDELGAVARALADAGKKVVLIYPSPEYGWSVPIYLAHAAHRGRSLDALGASRRDFETTREPFIEALDRIRTDPRIAKVDPSARLCDRTRCRIYANGESLYFDDDHLSMAGARYVTPVFASWFDVPVKPLADGVVAVSHR